MLGADAHLSFETGYARARHMSVCLPTSAALGDRWWWDGNDRSAGPVVMQDQHGLRHPSGGRCLTGRPPVHERPPLRSTRSDGGTATTDRRGRLWCRTYAVCRIRLGAVAWQGDLRFANGPRCARRQAVVGRQRQINRAGRDRSLPGTIERRGAGSHVDTLADETHSLW